MAKANYRVKRYNNAARPQLKALVVWKDPNGKRLRKFFNSIKEAETHAQIRETELLNQGRESLSFSSALRVMAQECQSQLDARGKTLRDATAHYLAYLDTIGCSVSVESATQQFLASKENRKTPCTRRYLSKARIFHERFAQAFPGKLIAEFQTKDCTEYLSRFDVGAVTYNRYTLKVSEFFSWCMGSPRKWCAANPAADIVLEKEIESPVGILTVDELSALLEAADSAMLPYLAIGAFAGIRSAELMRLDWSEIDMEDGMIVIPATKSKTARHRIVKMQPCLKAWIAPFAKSKGPVTPINLDFHLRRVRARAGIDVWPRNALRHSFASYHLARFKNASELALEMGHTTNKLIFGNYRRLVRESQAIEYWNIFPEDPENLVRLASQNGVILNANERERDAETGLFKAHMWTDQYQHKQPYYAEKFGVGLKIVSKWMHIGKPLDDPEAMAKLARGEYAHTIAEHAAIYDVPQSQVRFWRRSAWPLDNVERMKAYLAYRAEKVRKAYRPGANRALRVIPLSRNEAIASAEKAAAARQTA